MKYDIKRDGEIIATVSPTGWQTRQAMGVNIVDMSFTLRQPVVFDKGDTCIVYGELYRINILPSFTKINENQFEYTVQLEHHSYDLANTTYRAPDSANNLTQGRFNIMGDAAAHMSLWLLNANRNLTGWTLGVIDATPAINISYDGMNLLQVLNKLADEFKTEYWIENKTVHLTKRTGDSGITVGYGYNHGLKQLSKSNKENKSIFTRLYVEGGSKNLPSSYGANNLTLPNGQHYIEDAALVAKYGVIEAFQAFDDIFPKRVGAITALGENVFTFFDTNIDFNVNDQLASGLEAKIIFQTGLLAGYTFPISSFDNTTKKFIINEIEEKSYAAGKLPDATLKPSVGDTYIIIDIVMPQSYITAAQNQLQQVGNNFYAKGSNPNFNDAYQISCDRLHFKRNNIVPVLGYTLNIKENNPPIDVDKRIATIKRSLQNAWDYELEVTDNIDLTPIARSYLENDKVSTLIYGTQTTPLVGGESGSNFLGQLSGNNGYLYIAGAKAKAGFADTAQDAIHAYNADYATLAGNAYKSISPSFISGIGGQGHKLENGDLEVQNLVVNKNMDVYQLTVKQIRSTNGAEVISDAMIIKSVTDNDTYYRCYIDTDENTIGVSLQQNDIVRCQVWNSQKAKFYQTKIIAVGADYFDLQKPMLLGSGIPAAKDVVVRWDNETNAARQGLIYLTSNDAYSPYIDFIRHGVTKARLGEMGGIVSPIWGQLPSNRTGAWIQDLWAENAHISGTINVIGEGSNVPTKEEAQGYVGGLKIGGRNFVLHSDLELMYPNTNLFFQFSNYLSGEIIPKITVSTQIEYTNAEVNSYIGFVFELQYADGSTQFIDARMFPQSGESYKGRHSITIQLQNKPIGAQVVNWAQLNIGGVFSSAKCSRPMVEIGNKPSEAWLPAIEDAAAAILNAQNTANNANTAAATAQSNVVVLNTYVNGAFKDGVIEDAEAKAIEKYKNSITENRNAIVSAYNVLYANTYLEGSPKAILSTKKDAVIAAIDNLLASVNAAITDGKTTATEKSDVDAKYALYITANNEYVNAVELANKAIQDKLKGLTDDVALQLTNYVSDMGSDNKLTPSEKTSIAIIYNDIASNIEDLKTQAQQAGVDSSACNSAFIALQNYVTPLIANLGTTTDITGSVLRQKFDDYRIQESLLKKAIQNKNHVDTTALQAYTGLNDPVLQAKLNGSMFTQGGYLKANIIDTNTLLVGVATQVDVAAAQNSANTANNKIDNASPADRNLVFNSNQFYTNTEGVNVVQSGQYNADELKKIKAGDQFTVSIDIEYENAGSGFVIGIYGFLTYADGTSLEISLRDIYPEIGSSRKERLHQTFTAAKAVAGFQYAVIQCFGNFGSAKAGRVKVARGNLGHQWSQAPEDLVYNVGGRNYYRNSLGNIYPDTGRVSNIVKTETGFAFDFVNGFWVRISPFTATAWQWTVSFEIKTTLNVSAFLTEGLSITQKNIPANTWCKFSKTSDFTQARTDYYYDLYDSTGGLNGSCEIRNIQFEQGNVATDFTPAVEDILAKTAKLITLSGATQIIKVDKGGNKTPSSSFTITAFAQNTAITAWTYAIDGGGASSALPTGVTRSGDVVTVDPAAVTFKILTIKASDGIYADSFTIARAVDGQDGADGTGIVIKGSVPTYAALPSSGVAAGDAYLNEADGLLYIYDGASFPANGSGVEFKGDKGDAAYTVMLSNEAHTFPGTETAAIAGATTCGVLVLKGVDEIAKSITIGTLPTGLTASVSGSEITFTASSALTAGGVVDITIVADGKTFIRQFSFAISFKGAEGKGVYSTDVEYSKTTSATTAPIAGWQTTSPTWEQGYFIWSRIKTLYTDTTYSYSNAVNITGSAGSDGKSVVSIEEEYYLSTSSTSQAGGSWSTMRPAWEAGKYYWTRSKIAYANPTSVEYTTPIVSLAENMANAAQTTASAKAQTFTTTGATSVPYKAGDRLIPAYTHNLDGKDFIAGKVYETKVSRSTWLTADWNLADAQDAITTASAKAQTFTTTGATSAPYKAGDRLIPTYTHNLDGKDFVAGKVYETKVSRSTWLTADWNLADVQDAITAANAASTAANAASTAVASKVTMFSSTAPTNYKVGDVWVPATSITIDGVRFLAGNTYKAEAASATFVAAHWKADTLKNQLLIGSLAPALVDWVGGVSNVVGELDGKEGGATLRMYMNSFYPNSGNYIPVDRTKKYKYRFWARSSSDCNGKLYFSLRQFSDKYGTACAVNSGRSPYNPSNVTVPQTWTLYEYVFGGYDFQTNCLYVQPEFLGNYNGTAGYIDVNGFKLIEYTDIQNILDNAGGGNKTVTSVTQPTGTFIDGDKWQQPVTGGVVYWFYYNGVWYRDNGIVSLDYLKQAVVGSTQITGGLSLTHVLGVKNASGVVTAYINGANGNPNGAGIAFAAGVTNFGQSTETQKIALKHDGSGFLAGGKLHWNASGDLFVDAVLNAISGNIAGFELGGVYNKKWLKSTDGEASLLFENLNGNGFVRINDSPASSLLDIRTDSANRKGISIQTYANDAVGLQITSNTDSLYAIASHGGHQFYQRTGERWNAPGILGAITFRLMGTYCTVIDSWSISPITLSLSVVNSGNQSVRLTHNLGHTDYMLIPITEGGASSNVNVGISKQYNYVDYDFEGMASSVYASFLLIGRNTYQPNEYWNTAQTAYATHEGCNWNEYGSTHSYTQPANTFSSNISQADANTQAYQYAFQQAAADALANGYCTVFGE